MAALGSKMKTVEKFEVWKEYEKVAMHFNDLLIQLRIRALGGLGVVVAIVGVVAKFSSEGQNFWSILAVSLSVLFLVWLTIYFIDMHYYNKLLMGAVNATVELEINTDYKLDLSTKIKTHVQNGVSEGLWPISTFYFVTAFILLLGSAISICKAINYIP
ncbi:MAG: hypothetical protein ACI8VC_002592 [Candidatus Endobugula sp.]|jgi:hypothetical protein